MALTSYTKKTFVNGTTPAINASNLNNNENHTETLTNDLLTASYGSETDTTQQVTSLASTVLFAPLKEALLSGRSIVNILGSVSDATTGWSVTDCTIGTDASHEIFGTNALKLTLTASAGTCDYDVFSRLKTGAYYFISAYVKNGNATNIQLEFETDDADVAATAVTGTSYTRSAIVVQPSDFNTATTAVIRINIGGANTQYAYFDGVQMVEITSTEYALGADALLLKYPFHNDLQHSDKCRVKSVGKNLFDGIWEYGDINTTTGADSVSTSYIRSKYIKVKPSTTYIIKSTETSAMGCYPYDITKTYLGISSYLSNASGEKSFTTASNCEYIRVVYTVTSSLLALQVQLEYGSAATTYEPYTESTAIVPVTLRSVSDDIKDTFDCLSGLHTQNVSDVVTMDGSYLSGYIWQHNYDWPTVKRFVFTVSHTMAGSNISCVKYNNKKLSNLGNSSADDIAIDTSNGNLFLTVSNADTGFLDTWNGSTSFTDMSWNSLLRAYLNGWKLTTANVDVASCVWTGIASGTTKSGSSGYTDVTTTIDTGFQPYRMIYQLATHVPTNYFANVIDSNSSGTIIVEPYIEAVGVYNSGITIADSNYPISNLDYVNLIDTTTGDLTPISIADCTVAAGGLSFTISGASTAQYYKYGYTYVGLSSQPTLTYQIAESTNASISELSKTCEQLDRKIEQKISQDEGIVTDLKRKLERYGASSGGSDTYAVSNTTPTLAYYAGMIQTFKADVSNTEAATLNVDSLGAKDLKRFGVGGKAALTTGDIIANGFYTCVYDGTDFIVFNPSAILQSLFTDQGDIIYASAANTPAVLAKAASDGAILTQASNVPSWLVKGTAYQSLRMNSGATAPEWGASCVRGSVIVTSDVSGTSTYTETISLGFAALAGRCTITSGGSAAMTMITFADAERGAVYKSAAGTLSLAEISPFSSTEYSSLSAHIYISAAYIDGSNLKVTFYNTDGSTRTIAATIAYECWL
jgi:hypothetical protein